jgi:DNA modification methylase
MSSEDSQLTDSPPVYRQYGGVQMRRDGESVFPDLRLDDNPGMGVDTAKEVPGYPLGPVPKGDDVTYAYEGEPAEYPEMDFRSLVKELDDGHSIPNTTYLTHSIHKHPAIFIPHIPSYLIRQFTDDLNEEGERPLVLDPFSGSGTTGVEAKINGRDYFGVEINPLSRLVSEVSTSPIPPSLLELARESFEQDLSDTEEQLYEEYDAEFLDRTKKEHWFEDRAIRGLSCIRKVTDEFELGDDEIEASLSDFEADAIDDFDLSYEELRHRVNRWFVLMIANTVFEVSNADPGVSKAYKSKKMRRKIEDGEHPPNLFETHQEQLIESERKLVELWNEIYGKAHVAPGQQRIGSFGDDSNGTGEGHDLSKNLAHKAKTDIRLGDARTFDVPEYKGEVDIAITSPPYINAMNYYRGSKLRLFWIYDLLADDEKFDATELRKSIVGSNSVSMSKVKQELPASIRDIWVGTDEEFEATRLPKLDDDIANIHTLDHNDAERKAYVTWKFFAEDMAQNLARVYEHLKPGGYYFFVIGENTIGERLIHSHKYVADIAQNLGKIDGHGADIEEKGGFRFIGSAWDQITNRDLFQGRNHEGGVIECEWVVMLQKPRDD